MLQEVLMIMSIVNTPIVFYISYKLAKRDMKNEIYNIASDNEMLENVAKIGAAFGAGLMTQLKSGKAATGMGLKIGGFKIPQWLLEIGLGIAAKQGLLPEGLLTPPQQ